MSTLITDANQVTCEWLTEVLRRESVLSSGRVLSARRRTAQTNNAEVLYLKVQYSNDASGDAPDRLFLKLSGRRIEVVFYRQIAPAMPEAPLLHCYDAVFDPDSGRSHLLFEDLSATHFEPDEALPLPKAYHEEFVDALALIHAAWWEHPRLRQDILEDGEDVMDFVSGKAEQAFPSFVDFMGDRLSKARRTRYERLFARWPPTHRLSRLKTNQQVTLVHGDAHVWNFLYPRDPTNDTIRLVDWAVWHIEIGTNDLAYMMALHWYPSYRQQTEKDLVRRYHRRLREHGIAGYSWDQCWLDYRTSVVQILFWPIFDWSFKLPANIWWHNLERSMLAYEDLECGELL